MATINPQIPVVGEPNDTEDPKITSALGTIRDAINGGLDNANIADNAAILGSKLANTSIPTGKLENNSVTNDKIATDAVNADSILAGAVGSAELAALAVLSGKIKFVFRSGFGSFNANGVNSCVTIDDVLPGTYLAIGKYGVTTDCHSPLFFMGVLDGTLSQATSINNASNKMYGQGAAEYAFSHHTAMLQVTSTTSVGMTVNRSAGSGVVIGEAQLFGVLAS
jgi:hypothetical protein